MTDAPDSTRRSSRLHPPFVAPGEKLPSIDDFVHDEPPRQVEAAESADRIPSIGEFPAGDQDVDAEGWAVAGWQSYDWSRVAGLASEVPSEREDADADWTATDWTPRGGHAQRTPGSQAAFIAAHPSADEVASAFDAIARRIRSGELSIDQFPGTPPEVALAAALGAILKLRR